MSLKSLESEILRQLREVAGRRTLRLKDIMEWSTGTIAPLEGETLFHLPNLKVNCSVKTEALGVKHNPAPNLAHPLTADRFARKLPPIMWKEDHTVTPVERINILKPQEPCE